MNMKSKIEASEMPLGKDGSIYHMGLHADQLADDIILVGDPGRVPLISKYFDTIEHKVQNRELVTHTGYLNGKRVSAISTGMGTDNIDIVINELDALANIDLKTSIPKDEHRALNLIRIGTSGSLQAEYEVDNFCAGTYGLGMDGLLNYYKVDKGIFEADMEESFVKHMDYPKHFARPYIVKCDENLLNKLAFDMFSGITATAAGFFAPQGRELRLEITNKGQNDKLSSFRYNDLRISNFEMETSALYGLGRALGHNPLTICLLVANRPNKTFSVNYKQKMEDLIQIVLDRLTK